MHPYRETLIRQTLACLPEHRMLCLAALDAHRQQGPCPPLWCPVARHQYRRRQEALRWLQAAVRRSLQGHWTVVFYLLSDSFLPPDTPNLTTVTIAYNVRERWLTALLEHTDDPAPNLAFEDFIHPLTRTPSKARQIAVHYLGSYPIYQRETLKGEND